MADVIDAEQTFGVAEIERRQQGDLQFLVSFDWPTEAIPTTIVSLLSYLALLDQGSQP